MSLAPIVGLHHVTAIVSDPQRNLDFYAGLLGLRFVKRTVNFDDPGTYHFYFGDDAGSPGTIYTSFPWPNAPRATTGAGETTHIAYEIPAGSLDFWTARLAAADIPAERSHRFDEHVLTFADPDGMQLELVAPGAGPTRVTTPSRFSTIPPEHALRGFFGATLLERSLATTEPTLNLMGFVKSSTEGNRVRFTPTAGTAALGTHLDIVLDPAAPQGRPGAGTVHHIAFRAPSDEAQLDWRARIEQHLSVTTVQNRDYFHSIYFREPGGVLFELATDPPGFALDEPLETLGEALKIPEWLEPRREWIQKRLLPIALNTTKVSA